MRFSASWLPLTRKVFTPARSRRAEFAHEKQAGRDVAPVAVEHVAGDDEKLRAALDGRLDELFHGAAARGGEGGGDARVLEPERGKRTVDMQVGGVDELESHGATLRGRPRARKAVAALVHSLKMRRDGRHVKPGVNFRRNTQGATQEAVTLCESEFEIPVGKRSFLCQDLSATGPGEAVLKFHRNDLGDSLDFSPGFGSDELLFHDYVAAASTFASTPATSAYTKATVTSTTAASVTAYSVSADIAAHEKSGALDYAGALAVLTDAAAQPMNATLFSQLTTAAHSLNAVGGVPTSLYVQQMFDNVVLGNVANAHWHGGALNAVALGDLSATSSKFQFNQLIRKWFLGRDLPGVADAPGQGNADPVAYQSYGLPLFAGPPKLTDVNQGQVGDCWFLAALAETAMERPALIRRLITVNSSGTLSIEFQVNGQPTYVTVDRELPTYTGGVMQWSGSKMEFANSTTSLWVELFEKGLAQLDEQGVTTGQQYPTGSDQYYELNAGDGSGISLLTGQTSNSYDLGGQSGASLTALLGQMHNDLATGYDVMLGTSGLAAAGNLVSGHMFAVTSVDAATGMVGLYNPWGANAIGESKTASFTIAASALVADQATFFAASGAITAV